MTDLHPEARERLAKPYEKLGLTAHAREVAYGAARTVTLFAAEEVLSEALHEIDALRLWAKAAEAEVVRLEDTICARCYERGCYLQEG